MNYISALTTRPVSQIAMDVGATRVKRDENKRAAEQKLNIQNALEGKLDAWESGGNLVRLLQTLDEVVWEG